MSRNISLTIALLLVGVPFVATGQESKEQTEAQRRREAYMKLIEDELAARKATPHQSAEIMASDQAKLFRILGDSEASMFHKAKACQRLAFVGDAGAVATLTPLLEDAKLSHYARFALEAIPGPEAGAALRDALGKLEGNLLIGVINSIGRRKDTKAIDLLAQLRHSDSQEVSDAASAALGRIRSW